MTGFFMAWSMFLAIPCPVKKWDDAKRPQMLAALPFVGLVAGAVWLAVYKLCDVLSLKVIGLALTAAAPRIVTGFMHLDGFLDCADAVLSFRDRGIAWDFALGALECSRIYVSDEDRFAMQALADIIDGTGDFENFKIGARVKWRKSIKPLKE